jgi:hypothetical protein
VDGDFAVIKDAYPYIASRLLTDDSPELQSALVTLIFRDGRFQWEAFEALLDSAEGATEYDIVAILEQLAGFALSPRAEPLLDDIADELVRAFDDLGAETALYVYGAALDVLRPAAVEQLDASVAVASAAASAVAALRGLAGGAGLLDALEIAGGSSLRQRLPSSTRRALKLLDVVQRSSADAPRVGALAARLLSQSRVQKRVADFSLQLTDRAVGRGLQWLVDGVPVKEDRARKPAG